MRTLRRFLSRGQNLLALLIILFFVAVAVAAPRLAPQPDPTAPTLFRKVEELGLAHVPQPPSRVAPLGTTPQRSDIYFTLVWGTRSALRFGLIVTLLTATLGVLVGAVSGYVGGWINGLTMRITDAFLTVPLLAGVWMLYQFMLPPIPWEHDTAIFLRDLLERLNLTPLMLGFILFSWMPYARLVNANALHLRQVGFIEAARALGASPLRIILRHLLPNAISPAIVLAARDVGGVVMLAAAFTFIGVGDGPAWGALLVEGRDWIIGVGGNPLQNWWVFLPATLTLVLFGVGWNLLGDGLNSLLNPREQHR